MGYYSKLNCWDRGDHFLTKFWAKNLKKQIEYWIVIIVPKLVLIGLIVLFIKELQMSL